MREQLRILFVCSGNTCRSVMAQGLFQKMWREMGGAEENQRNPRVEAASAGTDAVEEMPASKNALTVLAEEGAKLPYHRAQTIKKDLIQEAAVILTMTGEQRRLILLRYPEAAGKTWTLGEYCGNDGDDVPDPYGAGLEKYRETAQTIKMKLRQAIPKLKDSLA